MTFYLLNRYSNCDLDNNEKEQYSIRIGVHA